MLNAEMLTEAVGQFVDAIGEDPLEVHSIDINPQRLTVRKFKVDKEGRKILDHVGQPRLETETFWFYPLGERVALYG